MDLQTRKLQFIQEFLRYADSGILARFEEILKSERKKVLEKQIEPMSLEEYEMRVQKAFGEIKANKVTSAKKLRKEIAEWK